MKDTISRNARNNWIVIASTMALTTFLMPSDLAFLVLAAVTGITFRCAWETR